MTLRVKGNKQRTNTNRNKDQPGTRVWGSFPHTHRALELSNSPGMYPINTGSESSESGQKGSEEKDTANDGPRIEEGPKAEKIQDQTDL